MFNVIKILGCFFVDADIFDKLCNDDARRDAVTEFGAYRHLVMLLFATDLLVLQCTLQALLNLVQR